MNWDDLRFLVTLGREGTLAAAARRLAVDQTTVARRLRALEEGLGTALFERDEGLWRPTAVGARVLERAARIEEDVAGITRLAEAGAGVVGGVVRITAVSALIGEWLAPRLPGLYARHPELCVDLVASNDNLNVARREADIAIRLARPASGDFLIRKLAAVGALEAELVRPLEGEREGVAPPRQGARRRVRQRRTNCGRSRNRVRATRLRHSARRPPVRCRWSSPWPPMAVLAMSVWSPRMVRASTPASSSARRWPRSVAGSSSRSARPPPAAGP